VREKYMKINEEEACKNIKEPGERARAVNQYAIEAEETYRRSCREAGKTREVVFDAPMRRLTIKRGEQNYEGYTMGVRRPDPNGEYKVGGRTRPLGAQEPR
jgi:hypothetical protein